MIWAISYGNAAYRRACDFNLMSAVKFGKADKTIAYGPEDIDEQFRLENQDILKEKRGNGYWLWKPYIILKTLDKMQDGEYLIYCDAGAFYKKKIQCLIDSMEAAKQTVMCFNVGGIEKKWTKRDAFILMDCDRPEYTDTAQRLAGYIVVKKSPKAYNVIQDWLEAMKDRRIVSDDENVMGYDNYPEFCENRNDQSAWSLITKKHSIPSFRDPSQYGNNINKDSDIAKRSKYDQVFLLHRRGDIDNYFKLWRHMFFLKYMYDGGKLEFLYIWTGKAYNKFAELKVKIKDK